MTVDRQGTLSITALKLHFSLQRLRHDIVSPPLVPEPRAAAVLMALQDINGELNLILTTRPTHLKAHPGQVSFPGGKVENQDLSVLDTALREAEEEIGLSRQQLEVLGQFPPHRTFTGYEITPVIAAVTKPFEPRIDPSEVAECFHVPLRFFLDERHRQIKHFRRQGHQYPLVFIPWQGRLIWGATAAMIDLLCRHLNDGGQTWRIP